MLLNILFFFISNVWMLFFILTFFSYLVYTYKKSKNKKLIFRTGSFRAISLCFAILILGSILLTFFFPEKQTILETEDASSLDRKMLDQLFQHGNYLQYLFNIIDYIVINTNLTGFLSAFFILLIWLFFLNRIDLFKNSSLINMLSVLIFGMLLTVLVFPLGKVIGLFHNIQYSQNPLYNILIYWTLKVGVVEEFVKLIPLAIIMMNRQAVKEPFDYIFYACVSAIGFAFIENLIYFKKLNESIISGRAMFSVVGHMIFSSVVAYGIVLFKFRKKSPITIGSYFLAAAFLHGLYDYLLDEHLTIIWLIIFFFLVQVWMVLINNCLNNSSNFTYHINFRYEFLAELLSVSLSIVVLINFLINGVQNGLADAILGYVYFIGFSSLLIIFFITHLANIDLVRNYWRPVSFKFHTAANDGNQVPGTRGFASLFTFLRSNFIIPQNFIGYKIDIYPPKNNRYMFEEMGRLSGQIEDRLILYTGKEVSTRWFVVNLPGYPAPEGFMKDYVLIKLENPSESIVHSRNIRCFSKLIPAEGIPESGTIRAENFPNYGFLILNLSEIPYVYKLESEHEQKLQLA